MSMLQTNLLRRKLIYLLRGSDNTLLRRGYYKRNNNKMSDVFKFPNGYDVTVCRKQDILDCLDANIIDKDVVLAVITQGELDASNFIKAGRWAGIPFLGSIRIPKRSLKLESTEVKTLLDDARQSMNTEQYMIFRQKLNADINSLDNSINKLEKQESIQKQEIKNVQKDLKN